MVFLQRYFKYRIGHIPGIASHSWRRYLTCNMERWDWMIKKNKKKQCCSPSTINNSIEIQSDEHTPGAKQKTAGIFPHFAPLLKRILNQTSTSTTHPTEFILPVLPEYIKEYVPRTSDKINQRILCHPCGEKLENMPPAN